MPIGVLLWVLSSYRFSPLYFSKCKYNSKGKSFIIAKYFKAFALTGREVCVHDYPG